MTEHLPECWAKHESDSEAWCICEELRACEQRVMSQFVDGIDLVSYRRGLDAAEAAVNEVLDRTPNSMNGEYITVSKHFPADLIAAIRALKEKP